MSGSFPPKSKKDTKLLELHGAAGGEGAAQGRAARDAEGLATPDAARSPAGSRAARLSQTPAPAGLTPASPSRGLTCQPTILCPPEAPGVLTQRNAPRTHFVCAARLCRVAGWCAGRPNLHYLLCDHRLSYPGSQSPRANPGQTRVSSPWRLRHFVGSLGSVQFSRSVVSNSLRPHEPQHTRPPCLSPTPEVHPNPCPLSR